MLAGNAAETDGTRSRTLVEPPPPSPLLTTRAMRNRSPQTQSLKWQSEPRRAPKGLINVICHAQEPSGPERAVPISRLRREPRWQSGDEARELFEAAARRRLTSSQKRARITFGRADSDAGQQLPQPAMATKSLFGAKLSSPTWQPISCRV